MERLGLELSEQALWSIGARDRDRVLELRAAGLDVAVRLVEAGFNTSAAVALAHELRMTVVAGEVNDRQSAAGLADLGFSAIAGPVVCTRLDLASLRRFLGPRDPWMDRIRVDAL